MHCLSKKVETCNLVLGQLTSYLCISCHHLWKGNAGSILCCINLLAFWNSLKIIDFSFYNNLRNILKFTSVLFCFVLFLAEEITLPKCLLTCMQSSAWLKKTLFLKLLISVTFVTIGLLQIWHGGSQKSKILRLIRLQIMFKWGKARSSVLLVSFLPLQVFLTKQMKASDSCLWSQVCFATFLVLHHFWILV